MKEQIQLVAKHMPLETLPCTGLDDLLQHISARGGEVEAFCCTFPQIKDPRELMEQQASACDMAQLVHR